jgi:hypothetical protein
LKRKNGIIYGCSEGSISKSVRKTSAVLARQQRPLAHSDGLNNRGIGWAQRHPAHSNGYNNRLLLARQQQPSYTQNGYNSSNNGEGTMATLHTAIDQKLQFTYP